MCWTVFYFQLDVLWPAFEPQVEVVNRGIFINNVEFGNLVKYL